MYTGKKMKDTTKNFYLSEKYISPNQYFSNLLTYTRN